MRRGVDEAVGGFLALAFLIQAPASGSALPEMPVETLLGKKLDVSKDIAPHLAVLVIGFTRASRDQTLEWSRRLALDLKGIPEAELYPVGVLADVPRLFRGFVIDRIRAGVPQTMHSRFLLVLQHEEAWKQVADFSDKDAAYVVILSHGGVAWRGKGALTETSHQTVIRMLGVLAGREPGESGARE